LIGVNFESNADDGYVIIKSDDNFWHMYFLQIRGRYIYATSSADVSRELELMGGRPIRMLLMQIWEAGDPYKK
jgi:hypothetical protein